MPSALFIAHLDDKRQLTVKRIELNRDIQETIEGIFEHQYQSFTEGVEEEIPFVRDWKPDKDEILTIQADRIPDTNPFLEAAAKNPISVTRLNINPESISVKALFCGKRRGGLSSEIRHQPDHKQEGSVGASGQCVPPSYRAHLRHRFGAHLHHRERFGEVQEPPKCALNTGHR